MPNPTPPTAPPQCPDCQHPMIRRSGRSGDFFGCSQFPRCRATVNIKRTAFGGGTTLPATKVTKEDTQDEWDRDDRVPSTPGKGFSFSPARAKAAPTHRPGLQITEPTVGMRRIAFTAFNKTIADEIAFKLNGGNTSRLFDGTGQQKDIWAQLDRAFTEPTPPHVAVMAGPGTGKTSSMLHWFASSILAGRNIQVQASTYHSLGLAMCKRALGGSVRTNRWKLRDIADEVCAPHINHKEYKLLVKAACAVVAGCKSNVWEGVPSQIDTLIDHHCIDFPEDTEGILYDVVPKILAACAAQITSVDFDDMLWLPVINNWSLGHMGFDDLITDETQDTAPIQRRLAKLACPHGRMVIVGDAHQAIYGWRGASLSAIQDFADELAGDRRGIVTLPLTITQRCPKSHVALMTRLFGPETLQAVDNAPEGSWRVEHSESRAISAMAHGDMVLCRINKPLIPIAYALLKRNIKAVIRGKDFGGGIITWINQLSEDADGSLESLIAHADVAYRNDAAQLAALGHKGEHRLETLTDRYECLIELCSGLKTVDELKSKIEGLFSDERPQNAVILSSIHRGKGLEAPRVWILKPDLMPHPKAIGWQAEQELNLIWVAGTRGQWARDGSGDGELVFVGPGLPSPLEEGSTDDDDDREDDRDRDDDRDSHGSTGGLIEEDFLPTDEDDPGAVEVREELLLTDGRTEDEDYRDDN